MNKPLFEAFPPVSTEEWEEQIRRELGDADYGETLLWHLPDGLTIRPYYREEDVARLENPADDEPVDIPVGWRLRQDIRTPDLDEAAAHARAAVDSGVDILGIDPGIEGDRCTGVPTLSKSDFEHVVRGLPLSNVELHLRGGEFSPSLFAFFLNAFPDDRPAVTLQFDPVAASARRGRRLDHLLDLAADTVRFALEEGLAAESRVLAVESTPYHEAGATPILETALHLGSLSETLVQMIERGLRAGEVLDRLTIGTPVGSSYFVEIARLRALRLCIRQLIDVFVHEDRVPLPPMHGETSWRNLTLFDPHENMLRATTEAASAIIGGCDVVSVQPFDAAAGRYDEFSYRMARNIQHLLRYESGFGRVADPAAGSYYVEVMTDAFARRAWQLFQEIESEGGLFEALESGFIHGRLESAVIEQRMAIGERRRVLVGTNHYPAPDTRASVSHPPPVLLPRALPHETSEYVRPRPETTPTTTFAELQERLEGGATIGVHSALLEGPRLASPLSRERLAEIVERRRLRIERLDHPPRVFILPFGDRAVRSDRADFAANFLGCGGFAIESILGIDDLGALPAALRDRTADVVVCCAPDEEYERLIPEVRHHFSGTRDDVIIGIVARPEVSDQLSTELIDFFIHRGSNLVEVLDDVQRRLGMSVPDSSEEVEP